MLTVIGWSLALLLWVVKDAKPLPEVLSFRTDRGLNGETADSHTPGVSIPTYWLMKYGEMRLRTTDRQAVAAWIRQHGSRDLKILTTYEDTSREILERSGRDSNV